MDPGPDRTASSAAAAPTDDRADPAERRRRTAVAGHTGDLATAAAALHDDDGDVRAAALGALARLGALRHTEVVAALGDAHPGVRRRAVELAARLGGTETDAALIAHARDAWASSPDEVELIAWCLGERHEHPGDDTTQRAPDDVIAVLVDAATTHPDALCRESAVAALGAIGDERGLPAVLAATRDKATVRRRAIVALAPFDGADVQAALSVALGDRDWQVRQIAEDLVAMDTTNAADTGPDEPAPVSSP